MGLGRLADWVLLVGLAVGGGTAGATYLFDGPQPCSPSTTIGPSCLVWEVTNPRVGRAMSFSPDDRVVYGAYWRFLAEARLANTGDLVWSSQPVGGNWVLGGGLSQDGHRFYVGGSMEPEDRGDRADAGVVAYDAARGDIIWQIRLSMSDFDYPTVFLVNHVTDDVFVAWMSSGISFLAGIDGASGRVRWINTGTNSLAQGAELTSMAVSPDGTSLYGAGSVYVPGHGDDYFVVALRAIDGAIAWSTTYDDPSHNNQAPGEVRVSPTGELLFVSGHSYRPELPSGVHPTQAYEASSGRLVWSSDHPMGLRFGAQAATAVSPDGSMFYVGGSICDGPEFTCDYGILAYDSRTGSPLWTVRHNVRAFSHDGVTILHAAGDGRLLYAAGDSFVNASPVAQAMPPQDLAAFDPRTGSFVWGAAFGSSTLGASLSGDGFRLAATGWRHDDTKGTALLDLRSIQNLAPAL